MPGSSQSDSLSLNHGSETSRTSPRNRDFSFNVTFPCLERVFDEEDSRNQSDIAHILRSGITELYWFSDLNHNVQQIMNTRDALCSFKKKSKIKKIKNTNSGIGRAYHFVILLSFVRVLQIIFPISVGYERTLVFELVGYKGACQLLV